MLAIATGAPLHPFQLSATKVNAFASQSTLDAQVGVLAFANANTRTSVSVVPHDADQALRFDFAFHDEKTAWKQWCNIQIPMANAPADLSNAHGLRFRARASASRTGRMEFLSWAREKLKSYDNEGWLLSFNPEWTDYEFLFADAMLPSYATAAPSVPLQTILSSLINLRIMPDCMNRKSTGYLGTNSDQTPVEDAGFIEVDNVAFF